MDEAKTQPFSIAKMLWKGVQSFVLTAGSVALLAVLEWASQPENVRQILESSGWSAGAIATFSGLLTALVRMASNWRKNG